MAVGLSTGQRPICCDASGGFKVGDPCRYGAPADVVTAALPFVSQTGMPAQLCMSFATCRLLAHTPVAEVH